MGVCLYLVSAAHYGVVCHVAVLFTCGGAFGWPFTSHGVVHMAISASWGGVHGPTNPLISLFVPWGREVIDVCRSNGIDVLVELWCH